MLLTHRGPTICAKKGTSLIVWMSLEELGTSPSSANDLLCDFSKALSLFVSFQCLHLTSERTSTSVYESQRSRGLYLTWCVVFKTKIIKSSLLPKASLPL